eukprot:1145631-Pelagomonas_calceolata.AAC.14
MQTSGMCTRLKSSAIDMRPEDTRPEGTRPGQQMKVAQWQQADNLWKLISAKAVYRFLLFSTVLYRSLPFVFVTLAQDIVVEGTHGSSEPMYKNSKKALRRGTTALGKLCNPGAPQI